MSKGRRLRITNPTGDPMLTRVIDVESGDPIFGVRSFSIRQGREDGKPYYYAEIHMEVEVDMVVDANVICYRLDERTGMRTEIGTLYDDQDNDADADDE